MKHRSSWIVAMLISCLSVTGLADEAKKGPENRNTVEAIEPISVEQPQHQGQLSPNAGSQMGVQLKLRRRYNAKIRPELQRDASAAPAQPK